MINSLKLESFCSYLASSGFNPKAELTQWLNPNQAFLLKANKLIISNATVAAASEVISA